MSKTKIGVNVQVDVSGINKLFEQLKLTDKEAKKAVRSGLRQSGNVIKKQAQANLQNVVKKNGSLINYQPLMKFIRTSVYKDSKGVTITGIDGRKRTYKKMKKQGKSDDYSYVLRFFNQGTVERKTKKKGYNRGSIQASYFFTNAVESKSEEAFSQLSANIISWINKVAMKRK